LCLCGLDIEFSSVVVVDALSSGTLLLSSQP
jgi:hypothetical protein